MRNRKVLYGILISLFVVNLVLAGIIFYSQNRDLQVIFLDVGQGDAILISQGNKQILIDGGPSGQAILDKLGRHIPFWDRKIEMIIATHPDQDHIVGLVEVMKNYKVDAVMETSLESDSQIYKKYKEIIQEKNIQRIEGGKGLKIKLAENQEMEILNPQAGAPRNKSDTNASSIAARLTAGEDAFLFTGDLPSEQEADLIVEKSNLNSRVLKIAHHGSKYSTGEEFLDKVNPKEAVISVGKNNRYGHPAPEILDRLRSKNIKILRTDEQGDIKYECNNGGGRCAVVAN